MGKIYRVEKVATILDSLIDWVTLDTPRGFIGIQGPPRRIRAPGLPVSANLGNIER